MGFIPDHLRKGFALLAFGLFLTLPVFAADHSEDHLVVNGESHYIRANPLNKFLSHHCKAERLEKYVDNFCIPYWPNYTRYWKIEDSQLYLIKIENSKGEQYPMDELFFNYEGKPMPAVWFSGILSYRRGNSPKIELNHVYYEEEMVVRVSKGIVTEIFKINHRDRWIEYARRLVEKHYPLSPGTPFIFRDPTRPNERMTDFLTEVLYSIETKTDEVSRYYPTIRVEINADLDDFELKESYGALSGYELMQVIAKETGSVLEVRMSGSVVTYAINERNAASASTPTE